MSRKYVPAAMRRLVRERAGECCEYCLIPETATLTPHWIDHIVAEKHGGQTEESNLALACGLCNQHKGTDLSSIDPDGGAITPLYHPRRDRWADHFRLEGGWVKPLTPAARVTVRLLQLNHPERVLERAALLAVKLMSPPSG